MRSALLACALLLPPPAFAGVETGFALRQNLLYTDASPLRVPGLPSRAYGVSASFIRPSLIWTREAWSLESALEVSALANTTGASRLGAARAGGSVFARPAPMERVDLTAEPVSDAHKSVRLRVERLKWARRFDAFDLEIGRQPVSLGTSHFVGVLDVLDPFPPGDLDASYKPGIDAARARTSLGEDGEAEAIVAAAAPWRESAQVARLRRRFGSMDVEALGGRFRRRAFGGAGWEGDAGPFAVWGEAALFEDAGSPKFSGVGGADARVAPDTTVGGGWFWQGFGAARAGGLAAAAARAPYREGWAFLGGRQYATISARTKPHPLVSLELAGLFNLGDASSLWQPRLTLNAADEMDLSLYGWWTAGRTPRAGAIRSEFGSTPDGAGVYARCFF